MAATDSFSLYRRAVVISSFLFLFEKQKSRSLLRRNDGSRSLVIVISTPSSSSSSSACLCLANKLIAAPLVPLCQPSGKEGDKSPASTIDAFAHTHAADITRKKSIWRDATRDIMTIIKPQKGDDWDNLCRPSITSSLSFSSVVKTYNPSSLFFFFLFVYLLSAFLSCVWWGCQ